MSVSLLYTMCNLVHAKESFRRLSVAMRTHSRDEVYLSEINVETIEREYIGKCQGCAYCIRYKKQTHADRTR